MLSNALAAVGAAGAPSNTHGGVGHAHIHTSAYVFVGAGAPPVRCNVFAAPAGAALVFVSAHPLPLVPIASVVPVASGQQEKANGGAAKSGAPAASAGMVGRRAVLALGTARDAILGGGNAASGWSAKLLGEPHVLVAMEALQVAVSESVCTCE
eukprot:TRINITY_DN24138_c0_g1_i1.p2 TRINITY_DN24138_c0_g1~~TRINITY_DN24138_c0_g1_i1.p2  ORF type:complete len:169 (-),score=35.08 TRINITY_DN24138_c0_g1_i1:518-979(-)